jgi:hypothetical protein
MFLPSTFRVMVTGHHCWIVRRLCAKGFMASY